MTIDTGLLIRRATLDDAPSVASLLGELGYPSTEAEARERLCAAAGSTEVLVAEAETRVVGLIAVQSAPYFPDGSTVMRITALVIAETERRRGIGRELIEAATRLAAQQNCSAVELTTAERRAEAHSFYESLGFAHVSRRYLRRLP